MLRKNPTESAAYPHRTVNGHYVRLRKGVLHHDGKKGIQGNLSRYQLGSAILTDNPSNIGLDDTRFQRQVWRHPLPRKKHKIAGKPRSILKHSFKSLFLSQVPSVYLTHCHNQITKTPIFPWCGGVCFRNCNQEIIRGPKILYERRKGEPGLYLEVV